MKEEETFKNKTEQIKIGEPSIVNSFRNFSFTQLIDHFFKRDSKERISNTSKAHPENTTDYEVWNRVKAMFAPSEHQAINPNLQYVITSAQLGLVIGLFYGGYKGYIKALNLYLLTNDTTKYANVQHARQELSKKVTIGFLKGGILMAPKIGFFLGCFTLVQTVVSEYRGQNGFLEYPIATGITMALVKWNFGVRGMLSGLVSGTMAGTFVAPIVYLYLKIIGLNMTEMKYSLCNASQQNEEALRKKRQKSQTENSDDEYTLFSSKRMNLPPGFPDEQ